MNPVRVTGVVRGAACLFACAFASLAVLAGPGDLDASFGTNGFARPTLPGTTTIHDAALQRDGKIVIVGDVAPPVPGTGNRNVVVIRLNPNGSLDTTFTGDGIAIVDYGGNDYAHAVLITADDKILLAGNRYDIFTAALDPALARFNSDGSLDATFGQGASPRSPPSTRTSTRSWSCRADASWPAGSATTAPTTTSRCSPSARTARSTPPSARTVDRSSISRAPTIPSSICDDCRATGSSRWAETNAGGAQSIGLMLVNSAGQLDTSFGPASGLLSIGGWNSVQDIELQADGKLLIAGGRLGRGFPVMGMVVRLNPDGTIDRSFGSEGRILRSDEMKQVVADASGRIYFAGELTAKPEPAPYSGRRRGYVEAVERDGAAARNFAASGGATIEAGRDDDL